MESLLEQFEQHLREDERSRHTIAAYRSDICLFYACLGDTALEALSKADILRYKDQLAVRYEVATRNRKLSALSRFLNFARESGLAVPALPIRFFETHHDHINWYVTENEAQRLIAKAEAEGDARAAAVFAGLFYSGARVSELLQITCKQAEQKVVRIVGKGKKQRNLYLSNEELRRNWAAYREARADNDCSYFFAGIRGRLTRQTVSKTIVHYAGQVRPRLKREKAHAHAFRHGCGMWLKSKGRSIDQVADILGHRSIETTRIYFRDTEADLLKMMQ